MPAYSLSTPSPDLIAAISFNEAQIDSNGVIGMPVYVKSNGNIDLARSDAAELQAIVAGLLQSDGTATFSARYSTHEVRRTDWTLVANTMFLTPGVHYFLTSTPGKISPTPPASGIVAIAGYSISQTEFVFSHCLPIRL